MAADGQIVPILVYNHIQRAHDFLVHAFGFASGGVHQDVSSTIPEMTRRCASAISEPG